MVKRPIKQVAKSPKTHKSQTANRPKWPNAPKAQMVKYPNPKNQYHRWSNFQMGLIAKWLQWANRSTAQMAKTRHWLNGQICQARWPNRQLPEMDKG